MSGGGVDVQLGWDAGAPQCEIHQYAVLRRTDDILPAMREEYWGRSRRDAQSRGQFILVLRLQVAWIDRDGKVRAPRSPQTEVFS